MGESIRRELSLPYPPAQVWRAITTSAALAQWLFPNDFLPRLGHRFTFNVPGNPRMKFDGLVVHCEVLECDPPAENETGRLMFSWSAGELQNTRVSFQIEAENAGTRLVFEHGGFDLSTPFGKQAFKGAEHGWARMLGQLPAVISEIANPIF